jgi:hypothetical protein
VSITENGGFLDPDGFEHGLLPEEPPASPPNHFVDGAGRVHDVDPEQCAAYYRRQGKVLPESVTLYRPDGTSEKLSWVDYGHQFRAIAQAVAAGQPLPPPLATASKPAPTTTSSGA